MKTSERRVGRALMGAAFALVMAGCATTQQAKVTSTPETYCPFLGNDICAKLTATTTPGRFSAGAVGGGEPLAGLRYINPNARWTQYSKVIIAPVSFWGGDDTTVSQADQQALTDYFTKALNDALSKKFPVVDKPGPGVMEVQVAIDDITKAVPVLRTVSMVIPQARALRLLDDLFRQLRRNKQHASIPAQHHVTRHCNRMTDSGRTVDAHHRRQLDAQGGCLV